MRVAYICDGLVPECSDKLGCFRCGKEGMNYCKHTFQPEHALNGACEDPWNYPQRFIDLSKSTGENEYWEGVFDLSFSPGAVI